MIDVALCIAIEHDPWLVVLAVFVCGAGAFSIVQLFERAIGTFGLQRLGWAFLSAVAGGATIWCTHFIAMLAYQAKAPVTLDPVLTIASLIIAVVGSCIGFMVASARSRGPLPAIGGAIFGLAISAMHFIGMAAYRVDGIVTWNPACVIAAIGCATIFGAAAFVALQSDRFGRLRLASGVILIVLAIALLHFVAMTALHIAPVAMSSAPLEAEQVRALAIATALLGLVVIAAGVFAALIDQQTRNDALAEMRHMAMSDALTGLPNRVAFHAALVRQIGIAAANGQRVGLCAIDLDRFKEINDLHGHKAGDDVLMVVAERLRHATRADDVVARLGGDEFVAIVRCNDRSQIVAFADRIDATLRAPMRFGQFDARLGASIGVAVYPDDGLQEDVLSNNADLAMYRAKCEGIGAPCYYDGMLDEAIRERRELANDLRKAIDENQLEVHYQVQASVADRAITGYEALLRWMHPQRGMIPPSTFIPVAEENGLILSLGEWVLQRACSDAMEWDHPSKVAVNVSALQLAHAELPQIFQRILADTGLPAERLEIELTESAIMADRDRALKVLGQIKALGVGVALDDFGTGYSSLETLRAFPFDKIKLDRFFTSELAVSPQATAIVRAVLALGRSLAIPVLAEGIETREQLEVLVREGCDEVQGFLFGRPRPMPVAGLEIESGTLSDAA
ncbi:diguanylate cyclase (GGDEF)-like protein [Sphingomonas zeicaulis]|uniref:putative bifunctional diguanylate cyclase/phosphodiesterase n=1 Tax=Sphingomonas zeicaulis TaxID=1632740 RepID=UPI003D208D35